MLHWDASMYMTRPCCFMEDCEGLPTGCFGYGRVTLRMNGWTDRGRGGVQGPLMGQVFFLILLITLHSEDSGFLIAVGIDMSYSSSSSIACISACHGV